MDKGEDTVDHIILEVCKDVWIACKAACAEGAASLSLVLISIHPYFCGKAGAENIGVIFA